MNTPNPDPPSSPDFPPRLIMEQMLAWSNYSYAIYSDELRLRHFKVGEDGQSLSPTSPSPLATDPAFADYFVSSLHLLGFILTTMKDGGVYVSDEEEGEGSDVEFSVEDEEDAQLAQKGKPEKEEDTEEEIFEAVEEEYVGGRASGQP